MKRNKRIFWTLFFNTIPLKAKKIANIIRKYNLYGNVGENCLIQLRKIPLHSELIFLHNNICIGSNVLFVTHDASHFMLNKKCNSDVYIEKVGCIEIMDNVFIGSGTQIMGNVRIGSNVIIGAGSIITKDIPDNSVYSGNPAKYICDFEDYEGLMKDYSESFKVHYGVNKLCGMNKELASKMYEDFLKEKNKKKKV